MKNHLYSLYQMVLKSLTFYLGIDQEKKKAGRPPKVSDLQLCALFILSYITNTPVFTLAKSLIDPNIKSYHLFRKTRTQKVYRLLKEYRNRRAINFINVSVVCFNDLTTIIFNNPCFITGTPKNFNIRRFPLLSNGIEWEG
jgi:hypothetical protein